MTLLEKSVDFQLLETLKEDPDFEEKKISEDSLYHRFSYLIPLLERGVSNSWERLQNDLEETHLGILYLGNDKARDDFYRKIIEMETEKVKQEIGDFFEEHLDKVGWVCLSSNPSIPLSFFEKHLDKVFWHCLSQNPSIPLSFFKEHIDKVYWSALSY